jgi:plasmid stabilization system protein ParE
MSKILYSIQARRRLRLIRQYIADECGEPAAAKRLISKLLLKVKTLEDAPSSGFLLTSHYDYVPPYYQRARGLICDKYLIIHNYNDEVVYIIDILHTRQDIYGQLFGDK